VLSSVFQQISFSALVALGVIVWLWLRHCRLTSRSHDPDDAVRLIKAAGQYFPLRLPRDRDKSEDDWPCIAHQRFCTTQPSRCHWTVFAASVTTARASSIDGVLFCVEPPCRS
jgi:hypothetical protein